MALANKHFPFTVSGASGIKLLMAWHIKENAGAAATVNIREGGVAGDIVVPLVLSANDSVGEELTNALLSSNGWYVEVVSGSVRGSLSGQA
jgi:hypothetical protein